MTHIVVGVEPEGPDQAPLRWAVGHAAAGGGDLTLVTAWEPDQAEVPPDRYEELEAQVRAHAERELARAEGPLDVPYRVVVHPGSPDDALARIAEDLDADLLVVGRPSGPGARWRSSVLGLVGRAGVPSVVAQPGHADLRGRTIVAALDGGDGDDAVLRWASSLADRVGGRLRAAIAVPAGGLGDLIPGASARARRRVDDAEAHVEAAERHEDLHLTVLRDDPADALRALAEEVDAPLVVTPQHPGILLDRLPAQLIDDAAVDVAVVPPEPARSAAP